MIAEESIKSKMGEWWRYFKPFYDRGEFDKIYDVLKAEAKKGTVICPDSKDTYRIFELIKPSDVKVVWVFYDPYASVYNGIKTASGVALDCRNRDVLQPSLEKFYAAIEQSECDGLDLKMERPPNLDYLIKQGNMFINTALTVPQNSTGAHLKLWRPFMEYFYSDVLSSFTGLIYVLCGKASQEMKQYISPNNYIFELEHPSFAHRNLRDWIYQDIFKKINTIIRENNGRDAQIEWIKDFCDLPF